MQTLLVTGGAGFIGTNFIRQVRQAQPACIINLDKLTYAGNLQNLADLKQYFTYDFVQGDIGNLELISYLLEQYQSDAVINFAAESHVDRSIIHPQSFIETNVVGTFQLLEASKEYGQKLASLKKERFRFLHVSTDELYGSLEPKEPAFREETPYAPNSPYAASKAASDHLCAPTTIPMGCQL